MTAAAAHARPACALVARATSWGPWRTLNGNGLEDSAWLSPAPEAVARRVEVDTPSTPLDKRSDRDDTPRSGFLPFGVEAQPDISE